MTDGTPVRDGEDLWPALRRLTAARIGLKRAGASLATGPLLDFQLAHAQARDAVQAQLDETALASDLATHGLPVLILASAAGDKRIYLMRPDLGRALDSGAETILAPYAGRYDLVIAVSDGLSAGAVQRHAAPLLAAALPGLQAEGWRIAPLIVVRHGRVAIGDRIAALLGATIVMMLIGERPGLSAPDSMSAYLSHRPNSGTSDADRNCVSNIRPGGTDYPSAAYTVTHLLRAIRTRKLSGVQLKDTSDRPLVGVATPQRL